MKRLVSVCLLMLCLSIPGFAGHTIPTGWCECGSFAACICDPGENPGGQSIGTVPDKPSKKPADLGSETLLILGVLLLMLRYKA